MTEGRPSSGFASYSGDVYRWAYRLLGRHHDALDVVQDVFLKWHEQCAREIPRLPKGWLRRVTLNQAIDRRRQRQPAKRLSDHEQEPVDASTVIGSTLDRESLRDDVTFALEQLTDSQRSVLVAKVYDGLTFREIARESDLAVSTVKTHYLRALRAVRDRLQPKWASEMQP